MKEPPQEIADGVMQRKTLWANVASETLAAWNGCWGKLWAPHETSPEDDVIGFSTSIPSVPVSPMCMQQVQHVAFSLLMPSLAWGVNFFHLQLAFSLLEQGAIFISCRSHHVLDACNLLFYFYSDLQLTIFLFIRYNFDFEFWAMLKQLRDFETWDFWK